jgi:hypothetical protein
MPLHRHKAVLTNERNKRIALEQQHAQVAQQLEALKWAQQPDMPDRMKALEIAESNPDLFIQVLKQDPRYAKLLTPAEAPAAPLQQQTAQHGERPAPDMQDQSGNLFYSPEGAAALLEWQEKVASDRYQKMLDDRFKPVEEERKALQEHKQREQVWNGAIERQRSILTDARATWDHFAELEPAIKATLADPKNRAMTLETAYRLALKPRIQLNRDTMRRELLAEINRGAPVAGSIRPGAGPAVAAPAQRSTEDIIMEQARRLEAANR